MPRSLSRVVNRLGQPFTIIRTKGSFAAGGWKSDDPSTVAGFGVVAVADDEALSQVPEGDRVLGSLQVICAQPIYETVMSQNSTEKSGLSDKIRWHGNMYRVVRVAPWRDYGFYSAILVRMTGA